MKIQAWSGITYLNEMKRQDADRDPDGRSSPEKRDSKKEEEKEADFETVMNQAEAFDKDPKTSELGLKASVDGQGPGLKVTLRDGTGAIVRQLSGEEFMKTRISSGISGRGKLLDRKG